jgi:hypothetical protein
VLRRSAEHWSGRKENSGTGAQREKINWEPARNGGAAAAQSYRKPLNGGGGRRRGVTLDRRMLVLCCEDEDGLEVGGDALLSGVRPADALNYALVRSELPRPGGPSPDWHIQQMSHSRKAVEFVGHRRVIPHEPLLQPASCLRR